MSEIGDVLSGGGKRYRIPSGKPAAEPEPTSRTIEEVYAKLEEIDAKLESLMGMPEDDELDAEYGD